ncbi:hypothetical protein F5Y14DRAFT_409581 [Nemania sp. NC0429]|nr:hypothetical protein F5Y14DRAFT_409581 [Nemania sp. NC0429]
MNYDNRSRSPLEILYPLPTDGANDESEVDIVAVHGLGSNVDWSWVWKEGGNRVNWLQDSNMLPEKVPMSRIIAYNYDSRWHNDASKTRLELCGEELIHSVSSFRSGASHRPVIFVGHSLGGNVIVDALLYADREAEHRPLLDHIVGLVFLGTPFRGTEWKALLNTLALLMRPFGSHEGIARELSYDEPRLLDKLHYFCRLCNKLSIPVSCFHELYETGYGKWFNLGGAIKGMVVKEASACIPGFDRHALQTDHLKINKYRGPGDRSFLIVSDVISKMCSGAKDIVRRRQSPNPTITDHRYVLRKRPEAENCLRHLFVTDPSEDRNALKRRKGNRASGTCEWILGTKELTAWLHSGRSAGETPQVSNLFWLYGNPGTGKSTMAIFITEELSKYFAATDSKTLAYFFCDSGSTKQNSATAVIRGLLLQLVQQKPQLLDYLLPRYQERGEKLFQSFDALWDIFMAIVGDEASGQKYVVIDALDECDRESQEMLMSQFEEILGSESVSSNLRILITSRPYEEIRAYLDSFMNKNLASFAEGRRDVHRCIEERVDNLAKKRKYPDTVKRQVLEVMAAKAEGTFLWVSLACEELKSVPSKDAVRTLQSIPQGLHALYKGLFDKAISRGDDGANGVRRLLSFVAVSMKPLTLLELSEACQLHQGEDIEDARTRFMEEEVASWRLMIVIQGKYVYLLHKSVRDFLVEPSGGSVDIREAHANLAYRSIDVLIEHFHKNAGKWDLYTDFSRYACRHWPNHARLADCKFNVKDSQAEFFTTTSSPCRNSWLENYQSLYHKWDRHYSLWSIWHVAAGMGIPALVNYLPGLDTQFQEPDNRIRSNSTDGHGRTPIVLAALEGHLNLIPKMLDANWEDITPLGLAAAENYEHGKEFLTLLLNRPGQQIAITEHVLRAAAFYHDTEVMALLLNRRGDQGTITEKVVEVVAKNSRSRVMAWLFNRWGDQVTITERVVEAAAGNVSSEVMALLLDRWGDQFTITEKVVEAAARNISSEVIRLLFDRRGDQFTITERVVEIAARNMSSEVMALLLDRRGDQFTITERVVEIAAWNTGSDVMALLLNRRGNQVTITEKVLEAAAKNPLSGTNIMALLLNQCQEQMPITAKVLEAAAGNNISGKKTMALLLDRQGNQITITENVLEAAAGNVCAGEEIMYGVTS